MTSRGAVGANGPETERLGTVDGCAEEAESLEPSLEGAAVRFFVTITGEDSSLAEFGVGSSVPLPNLVTLSLPYILDEATALAYSERRSSVESWCSGRPGLDLLTDPLSEPAVEESKDSPLVAKRA